MPAARQLSALVQTKTPVAYPLRQVARILAAQHASAPRSAQISAQGTRDALASRWNDNLEQATSWRGRQLDADVIATTGMLARRFLAGRENLLAARISSGHIVDGHGDLRADDIYCLDDGPRILDCLDFDDRLRWVDGLDDAAFLAMDLEQLGAPQLARQFVGWYAEYSGDLSPSSLCHHYVAYRAFVRAKVACIQASQGEAAADGKARQFAAIALRHLHAGAVALVLVGGLPGTGKSTLAGAVADRLGWTALSTDRIRKELSGSAPQSGTAVPWGTGNYTESWTERTYSELLRRAASLLANGESVIADASWMSHGQRAAAAAVAAQASADLVQLRCTAPQDLARQRMRDRPHALSDADADIAARMAASFAPWPAATSIDTGTTAPARESRERAVAVIRPHGPQHVWHASRPVMLPG